ncbi:hypothetical protein [Cetobacterium sp.]|uniref:hypothetical protein n=1 Tax=Cetobacterium sp. TaxID=2071632 RepID=UPI003F34679E
MAKVFYHILKGASAIILVFVFLKIFGVDITKSSIIDAFLISLVYLFEEIATYIEEKLIDNTKKNK